MEQTLCSVHICGLSVGEEESQDLLLLRDLQCHLSTEMTTERDGHLVAVNIPHVNNSLYYLLLDYSHFF